MNKKLIIKIITLLLIIVSFSQSVDAISAGVSPPKINIYNALPGNDYNLSFAVYNMGNETTDYSIEVKGNISNWTYINITKVQVKDKDNYPVSGIIRVPSNILIGNYTGNILIKSIPNDSITGNKVSVGVNLPITMNITNKTISIDNKSTLASTNLANESASLTESPAFPYLVAIILILLIGLGYFLLEKHVFSKMDDKIKKNREE